MHFLWDCLERPQKIEFQNGRIGIRSNPKIPNISKKRMPWKFESLKWFYYPFFWWILLYFSYEILLSKVFNLLRYSTFWGILSFEIHPFCSSPFQHSVYEIRPFLEKSYFTLFHWTEQRSALVMLFYLKTFCSIFSLGNTLTTLTQLLQITLYFPIETSNLHESALNRTILPSHSLTLTYLQPLR